MTHKIHLLSEQTINQIAAGEVIENPASVIKELVENAVDAGATKILIETWGGGFSRIRISDNGSGMSPHDALRSLERHATSKLNSADDLFSLQTMGFRGEALASIAAISKLTLLTAEENAIAAAIEVEGGKVLSATPGARARGTTIDVRSLFYNVPARKKFQKTAPLSTAEITKAVTHLALAHPSIGFELIHQERSVFSLLPAAPLSLTEQLSDRSSLLLGDDFKTSTLLLTSSPSFCSLAGVIGSPLTHRHHRGGQYLFVNNRPVQCPAISYAVRDAYATRLPTDRHPIYVLHLHLPSHLIDVNVHPQKKEIRLREEKEIRAVIHNAVNAALEGNAPPTTWILQDAPASIAWEPPPIEPLQWTPLLQEEKTELPFESPPYHVLGISGHFLLLDGISEPGLMLIDLPALQTRLVFDQLTQDIPSPAPSQHLLIPLSLSLSLSEAASAEALQEDLLRIGFDITLTGKQSVALHALPSFLKENDASDCLHELLETQERSDPLKRQRALAQIASRYAKSRTFTLYQAESLYQQWLKAKSPPYSPSGKPISLHLTHEELDARFHLKK